MDDKKKILILGALAVVIIGVGAFQFSKSGDAPPAPAAKKEQPAGQGEPTKTEKTSSEAADAKGTEVTTTTGEGGVEPEEGEQIDPALIVAAKLAPRDPFDGRRWDRSEVRQQPPQPSVNPAENKKSSARPPRGISGSGFKPIGVPGLGGVLPEAGGTAPVPNGKLPSVEDFPYSVAGTMMGDKPLVVLTDASGKQKIVTVGSSIDGDSQVISISSGKVTVRHRGKTKIVPVGGTNPSNNKEDNQ